MAVYAGKKRTKSKAMFKRPNLKKKAKTMVEEKTMEAVAYSIPRTIGTLPTQVKCHFKYGEQITLSNGGAGLTGVGVYSCNGLYDPNVSGIGHQPRGFDQLMAMYDHYVVIGSRIKVQFWPRPANTGLSVVGISVQDTATVFTDFRDYLESPNNVTQGISPDGDRCKALVNNVNPNQFLGRKNPMSDPQLKGSSTANPTEQCYYHLWLHNVTDSDTNDIVVEIEYTAILIEPKVAPIS